MAKGFWRKAKVKKVRQKRTFFCVFKKKAVPLRAF